MSSSKNGILIRKAGRCGNERCYFFALASFNFENVFASFGFTVLFVPIACLAWPQKRYMKNETVLKASGFCGSFLGLHIIWLVDDIKIKKKTTTTTTKQKNNYLSVCPSIFLVFCLVEDFFRKMFLVEGNP